MNYKTSLAKREASKRHRLKYRERYLEYAKQYRINNKEKIKEYREKRKLKNREYYHKTKDDLEKRFKRALRFSRNRAKQTKSKACTATLQELIDSFTGFCKVCNIAEIECNHKLNMDHCHKTGKFRGWLCENCNRALGCVKDDPRILNNLMEYLNENSKRNV